MMTVSHLRACAWRSFLWHELGRAYGGSLKGTGEMRPKPTIDSVVLRRQAEARLKAGQGSSQFPRKADLLLLHHELSVRQIELEIELEMQAEDLQVAHGEIAP